MANFNTTEWQAELQSVSQANQHHCRLLTKQSLYNIQLVYIAFSWKEGLSAHKFSHNAPLTNETIESEPFGLDLKQKLAATDR